MPQRDAQRSQVHETTEDAAASPTHGPESSHEPNAKGDKQGEPEKAVLDTDLKPAQDDADVGGPVKISSDDILPRRDPATREMTTV